MKFTKIILASWVLSTSMVCFAGEEGEKPAVAKQDLATTCPSKDFKIFFEAFAESEDIQYAFTQIPGVKNDETTFPMIQNAAYRKKEKMHLKTESVQTDTAKVLVDRDHSTYLVAFYFQKTQNCWMLVKVEDLSG